ncbi:hypothetical protein [Micromonospora mirobrigensis]|uniref:Uncharacterized protein n=1 Tax=Micromonospora mirobrigensis TaxID=262898 RepID=A0A1C4YUM7_9ACTN|nr:hypothetical protein [Micromonospora mirobrigensis]SCF24356.1 hypothetical protein GA0070564_104396 [Micromonospora mirobrigensis]
MAASGRHGHHRRAPGARPGADGTTAEPGGGRRWSPTALALTAAAVVVVVLGAAAVVATLSRPDRLGVVFSGGATPSTVVPAAGEPGAAGGVQAAAAQALTAPLAGRRAATFALDDGLTNLALRVTDLGDDLYRIGGPVDSGIGPRPEVRGDLVRLRLEPTGRPGAGEIEVLLNSRVTWGLRLAGGVREELLDLSAARAVSGIDMVGGAARIDLRLPPIAGALTVRMSGGVNGFTVRLADAAPPVRIRVASGAGSVTLHGQRREGVAAGDTISSPGWDRSVDRLYLDLAAGANTVIVGAGPA